MIAKNPPGNRRHDTPVERSNRPHKLRCDRIQPHPLNPRRDFDQAELQSLADSMTEHGLIEPIIVRRLANKNLFELIAGERRLRAATLAGWSHIAVIVRDATDSEALALQLIENLQRKDLNAIEKARGLEQLCRPESESGAGKSQRDVAQLIGKSPTYVQQLVQLLVLPAVWQDRIINGELSYKKALQLVPYAAQPVVLARLEKDIVENPWAYRSSEDFARNVKLVAENAPATRGASGAASGPPSQRLPRHEDPRRDDPTGAPPSMRVVDPSDDEGPAFPAASPAYDESDVAGPAIDAGDDAPSSPAVRSLDVAGILAAIDEVWDLEELDRIMMAIVARRKALAANFPMPRKRATASA
jgi:ParB/RepB/Spo0J family partition protein